MLCRLFAEVDFVAPHLASFGQGQLIPVTLVSDDLAARDRRWIWCPAGLPQQQRQALASSRIGRVVEEHALWFQMLRAACAAIDPAQQILLTVEGTAAALYVEHAAQLFGVPLAIVYSAPNRMTFDNWVTQWLTELPEKEANHQVFRISVSPPLSKNESDLSRSDAPINDRLLFAFADELLALHVRRNGNTDKLLRERLRQSTLPSKTQVAVAPELVSPELRDEYYSLGAVGRAILQEAPRAKFWHLGKDKTQITTRPALLDDDRRWLVHCTRRCDGPWPDQAPAEHLHQLILAHPDADHSALATLARILRSNRLLASNRATRGKTHVVSFTAVALDELSSLRVFRPHRGTWDFMPFGICIDLEWLQSQGAKPVQYASADQWADHNLNRTYFQPAISTTRTGNEIDWTVEQEWRLLGDIDISQLAADQAKVFVSSEADAAKLDAICCWPILVVQ